MEQLKEGKQTRPKGDISVLFGLSQLADLTLHMARMFNGLSKIVMEELERSVKNSSTSVMGPRAEEKGEGKRELGVHGE